MRRHPLAQHLAIVIAAAGVFGSLAYFALGVGGRRARRLDRGLRGGARRRARRERSCSRSLVQLAIAPRLLARLGTGHALLLAPLVALAAALGLVLAPILAVAIATQMSARVLDASIETPAEKLAQTLLPSAARGRVQGFLDGTAKRGAPCSGGLIAAALTGSPTAVLRRDRGRRGRCGCSRQRGSRASCRGSRSSTSPRCATPTRSSTSAPSQALLRELEGARPERAAEVIVRLHERGRIDAVAPLVRAVAEVGGEGLWRALIAVLDEPSAAHGVMIAEAARRTTGKVRVLAIRAVGLARGVPAAAVVALGDSATTGAAIVPTPADLPASGRARAIEAARRDLEAAVGLTSEIALHRLAGESASTMQLLADAVREPGITAAVAIDELCVEIACGIAAGARRSHARGRAPPRACAASPARGHDEPHLGVRGARPRRGVGRGPARRRALAAPRGPPRARARARRGWRDAARRPTTC